MRFAQAIINGKAPGPAALKTSTKATDRFTIGLAWHAVSPDGEGGRRGDPVVWHNGGTGGTRTMLALDLKAKQAVLVLNNSSRTVDDLGSTPCSDPRRTRAIASHPIQRVPRDRPGAGRSAETSLNRRRR